MKFLGNIIWLIFGGLITSIEYLVSSLLLMVTIIGIPFGLQTLKLALLALWPFGSTVTDRQFRRLPLHYHEHSMDHTRRFLDLPDTPGIRVTAVYHHHRYPLGKTTFQDGSPCPDSFR